MARKEEYNFVIYPTYRYVTLNCNQVYFNTDFEKILKILGKYYFNEPSLGTDGICSRIKDRINCEWHLNGFKMSIQQKRVSTNQIKTIRRSFRKLRDIGQNYIRIPFSVVPILFFILNLLHCIPVTDLDHEEKQFMNSLIKGGKTISEQLYDYYVSTFLKEYDIICSKLTDEELINKYKKLYANLTNRLSIMNCTYCDIDWDELPKYIIC